MKTLVLLIAMSMMSLTPEEHAAIAAAEINQQYAAAAHAAEINRKVWILTPATTTSRSNVVDQIVTTLRAPNGHTHTCANKHTWDHKENSGHVCTAPVMRNGKIEQCGLTATIQDSPKKMVTMVRAVRSAESTAPAAVIATREITRATPVNFVEQYIMPARVGSASSACANGQCSTVTRWR